MTTPTKTKGGHPIKNFEKLSEPKQFENIEAIYCGQVDLEYFGGMLIYWNKNGICNNHTIHNSNWNEFLSCRI